MRILFVVRGLNVGGAQRQLVAAARGLRRRGHDVAVAVFYGGGIFEEELRTAGIPIHDLSKRGRWDVVPFLLRLIRTVRRVRPDVVHAYMGGANVFSALGKPLFPSVKLVWGIRTAMTDLSAYDWLSRVGRTLERRTAPLADAIITNSEAARRAAVAAGMTDRKFFVIPNGIDCEEFRPDPAARAQLREEWGIRPDQALIGIVSRLDPVKNHGVFLRAAAMVSAARGEARFVCVGRGDRGYADELRRLGDRLGLSDRLTWAGERRATRGVYSALDVAVLSSDEGESFPNVVAEAMACGVPCVVTESGAAAEIVADTGAVVPRRDPVALAEAIQDLVLRALAPGSTLGVRARARIEQHYSTALLATRTEHALTALTAPR